MHIYLIDDFEFNKYENSLSKGEQFNFYHRSNFIGHYLLAVSKKKKHQLDTGLFNGIMLDRDKAGF